MRYIARIPAEDQQLSMKLLNEGWKETKEPKNLVMATLCSFPFVFVLAGFTAWLAYLLKPELFGFHLSEEFSITFTIDLQLLIFLIMMYVYTFVHEMIHGIFFPDFIKSKNIFWGLNGVYGFVLSTDPIGRNRFLIISVMPFLILSPAAVVVFYLAGILNWFTLGLCLINAAGSCVDLLNFVLIGVQVKKNQRLINNGFKTYYK